MAKKEVVTEELVSEEVIPAQEAVVEKVQDAKEEIKKEVVATVKDGTQYGIEETKDVVILLAKLGVSIAECTITGKFSIGNFIDDIKATPAAVVGITKVPQEIKDLNSKEVEELLQVVVVELAPLGIKTIEAAKHFVKAGVAFVEGVIELKAGFEATKAK